MPYVAYTEEELIELCDTTLLNRMEELQKQMLPILNRVKSLSNGLDAVNKSLNYVLATVNNGTINKDYLVKYRDILQAVHGEIMTIEQKLVILKKISKHDALATNGEQDA